MQPPYSKKKKKKKKTRNSPMVASMRNTGINPNPVLNAIIPYYLELGKTYLI